jgi:putative CocE/NonD family hydrolase
VRFDRNVLVSVGDGTELAASLYRPDHERPAPVLISFYPYRKDDVIGSFSEHSRRSLVERGYAHLLVDVRGFGGSDGSSVESQDPRAEGRDAAAVVQWAAAQEWCDGTVGVWGVSYGGLVALAVGAERPPALRAIASIYGLQDVVREFVAPGNVRAGLGLFQREAVMLAQELSPPSFEDADGRWRAVWERRLERLRGAGPSGPHWLAHPEGEDPYWRARTIKLERIEVPAFIVGGWRDLFPSATVEAFNRIETATDLLIGPWLHVPPDLGPEPVDWIGELAGFFDLHLRGEGEARARRAQIFVDGVGGGWSEASAFPPAGVEPMRRRLGSDGGLELEPSTGVATVELRPTVGATAGLYDPLGTGLGFPLDQRPDDARSACWTGEPALAAVTLAGSAEVALDVTIDSTGPVHLTAKLTDVGPDGSSSLVATGARRIERSGCCEISLAAIAYRLAPGHRWQLALSGSDFPRAWPSPAAGRVRIALASATLSLPLAPEGSLAPWAPRRPPQQPGGNATWSLPGDPPVWRIERDSARSAITVHTAGGDRMTTPSGATMSLVTRAWATVSDNDPAGARIEAEAEIRLQLPSGVAIEVDTTVVARVDRDRYTATVRHDGSLVFDEAWERP